ncbi:hypothetical protein GOODEAATRI_006315 [Goodea atripinnis]|uniref:Uncharacterized protein n=1 Tax=Goodea atripinnis TaxID=208336 RepID=A0ABV0PLB4_9TELE
MATCEGWNVRQRQKKESECVVCVCVKSEGDVGQSLVDQYRIKKLPLCLSLHAFCPLPSSCSVFCLDLLSPFLFFLLSIVRSLCLETPSSMLSTFGPSIPLLSFLSLHFSVSFAAVLIT